MLVSDPSNNQTNYYYAWSYKVIDGVFRATLRVSCHLCKPFENDTYFHLNHLDNPFRIMDERMLDCARCGRGCILPYDCASAFLWLYQYRGIAAADAILRRNNFKRLPDFDTNQEAKFYVMNGADVSPHTYAHNDLNRDMMANRWLSSYLSRNADYRDQFMYNHNTPANEPGIFRHNRVRPQNACNERWGGGLPTSRLQVEYTEARTWQDILNSQVEYEDDVETVLVTGEVLIDRTRSYNLPRIEKPLHQLGEVQGMLGKSLTTHGLPSVLEELAPVMEVALIYTSHGNM